MTGRRKNIAAVIIIICIISVIIGVFIPREKNRPNQTFAKNSTNSNFSLSPAGFHTPFKGERIAVIKLDGVISDSQGSSLFKDQTSSNAVLDLVIKATKDPSVKGILIRINSPGGTVAASQEIYRAVLKARKKKPVVITMGDVAASGGYYIAAAGDKIFANSGTLTGSIGVITSYLNFYELLNKIGVKGITIKSGVYKDIGNPTRPLTEEEKKILQAILDDSYNQFLTDVSIGRKTSKEKIAQIAQGLIYTGRQAKKIGLVDYLGDYQEALCFTQRLVKKRFPYLQKKYGKKDIPVDETWKGTSILDILTGVISKQTPQAALENKLFKQYSYSRFQPLWLLE